MKKKWMIFLIALSVGGSTQYLKKRDACARVDVTLVAAPMSGVPGPLFLLNP